MNANANNCTGCGCAKPDAIPVSKPPAGVHHEHARLPAILQYRGLKTQAAMAARLVKVESLATNMRSVLDEVLAAADGEAARPCPSGPGPLDEGASDRTAHYPHDFAATQARLMEDMLETALFRLRTTLADAGRTNRPPGSSRPAR